MKCSPPPHSLTAVPPSNWMNKQASSSHWNGFKVQTIHNPVPKSFYEPLDRESCKKALGLSLEKPVFLSIAGNLDEERKGGPILKEILESDVKDHSQFLLIGQGNQFNDHKIKSLGYVQDEITLRIAYHAADVLLHPALVDNLPNTVAESMSCGTPVLAFHTGGLPEMVVPDKSGWLVESIQSGLMIKTLNSLLSEHKFTNDMRVRTQALAKGIFNTQVIGDKYYHTLRQ